MLLRTILKVRYDGGIPVLHTAFMYKQLGILKVNDIFKLRIFKLLVSLLSGSYPEFYDLLLRPYLTSHNHSTRNGIFRCPLVVCEVERRAASYQLIRLYDEVPACYHNVGNKAPKPLVNDCKKYI